MIRVAFIALITNFGFACMALGQIHNYHVTARLVQVPVEIFNSHGQFMHGLTSRDFVLRVNGKIVPIEHVDSIRGNAPISNAYNSLDKRIQESQHGFFTNHMMESPQNRIIFLFDRTHISRTVLDQLIIKIRRILQKPIPGNEDIAVLEENPGLIELQSFTQNRIALQHAVKNLNQYYTRNDLANFYRSLGGIYGGRLGGSAVMSSFQNPTMPKGISAGRGPAPGASNLSIFRIISEYMSEVITRQQYYGTIDTLKMLSRMLSNIPGHKEILWFTNDTDYTAPGNQHLMLSGKRMRHLVRLLNNANISLFPIDPDGLATYAEDEGPGSTNAYHDSMRVTHQGVDPFMLSAHDISTAGAATFAARTGGRAYSDFNSITKILHNAQRYWNTGYVLYFQPTPAEAGKKFNSIKIQSLLPGMHLIYRQGFYLHGTSYQPRTLTSKVMRKLAIAPMDWHGLPISIQLKPMGPALKPNWKPAFKGEKVRRDLFKLRLPMKLLLHHMTNGQYSYDFTTQIFTINLQTGAVSFLAPSRFHNILATSQAKELRSQINYFRASFIVDSGIFYMGRVILRDNYSHLIGSVTVPLNALIVSKTHH